MSRDRTGGFYACRVTFLAPIPALIAAGLAVPTLLVFYFLRLRRRPVRVSSTLLWMQATRDLQVNVPLRMIRPSWLLVIQLLILASLLLALARPAVHMEAAAPGRAVILIDRSASMSAMDGLGGEAGRTRLEEALERAEGAADRLGRSGTLVSVVAYGADARMLTGMTTDRGAVREAIRSVRPGDQPDNLRAALDLVAAGAMADRSAASDEGGAPEPVLVVLFSDGGTPPPEGLSLDNAQWRFESVGPSPEAARENLGIVAISARRDYRDPATVRLFARIVNAGAEAVATVAALTVGGEVVDRKPLEVPGSTGPAASQVGEAAVSFEFQNAEGGVAEVVIGRSDLLAADNRAAVVLASPQRPGVLLVQPDGTGGAGNWWVGDVLAELDFRPLRNVSAGEYSRLAEGGGLGPYSLVVFDRVRPRAAPPVASLSLGAGMPSAMGQAGDEASRARGGGGSTRFVSWDRMHPVLRDVALDSVVIGRSMDLLREVEIGADGARRVTELARGEGGPLVALVEDGPVRRIVVGFEPGESNWPLTVGFAIFLSNAVDFLTLRGEADAAAAFTTAEPVRVAVRDGTAAELEGPVTVRVPPGVSGMSSVGVLERAGVYSMRGDGGAVAVNLVSPVESAVRTARELSIAGRPVASVEGGAGPREVWPWLVMVAAALLGLEWILHAIMMKV